VNATTKIAPVNGIPVALIHDLIAKISADPTAGLTRWRVTNTWQGGARNRADVNGFEIGGKRVARAFDFSVNEPVEIAGTNTHANPQEYLLGALNACMMTGFTALCALHGYEIETLEIVTEGDIDLSGFLGIDPKVSPGYDALTSTMTVKGSARDEDFQQIFQLMLATSPNVHNITRPVALKADLLIAGS
jgi:hypothetical protein